MRRLVWILGVVAALAVVLTTVAAAFWDAPAPAGPSGSPEGRSEGWSASAPGTVIAYRDASGRELVRIREPRLLGAGFCPDDPTLSRAFAGSVPRHGRPVGALARRWAQALALDVVTGERLRHGPLRVTGGRVEVWAEVPPGPCHAARAHITVTADGARARILVRDLAD